MITGIPFSSQVCLNKYYLKIFSQLIYLAAQTDITQKFIAKQCDKHVSIFTMCTHFPSNWQYWHAFSSQAQTTLLFDIFIE